MKIILLDNLYIILLDANRVLEFFIEGLLGGTPPVRCLGWSEWMLV